MFQVSVGTGSTAVTLDADDDIFVFPHAISGFFLRRYSGTAALYIGVNVILVEDPPVDPEDPTPAFAGEIHRFDGGSTNPADLPVGDDIKRMTRTELIAKGFPLSLIVGSEKEFKGWASYNGGAQIRCVSIVNAGAAAVHLGQTDVSN